jgi:glutaredoxin
VLRNREGISERAIFVIDRSGTIRYIDIHAIGERPDNEEVRKVLREIESQDAAMSAPIPAEPPTPDTVRSGDEIVLYCARWCHDCGRAKRWLEAHQLAFVELDIDYEPEARSRVKQWCDGKLITPIIDFYGTLVIDYDETKLEELLRNRAAG